MLWVGLSWLRKTFVYRLSPRVIVGRRCFWLSEDLDEILELADRTVVMFNGQLVYETTSSGADLALIGRHMTGHAA